ncbi:MAG: tetratricopeptide repeat protein [Planctomycetes bacterium]|nr:tetratricopeptide repeat protein [Planctomycetota bacterium]
MRLFSHLSNELGRSFQDRGWFRAAGTAYSWATSLQRDWSLPWYNRGLLAKFERRWAESLEYNQRATDLDPQNEPAWWNLGIAATALGDWATARRAWAGFGIKVPEGEGPLDMALGPVPIRVSPHSRPEVVWAERLDPARARINSVPLPECERGYRDLLLHDGEPRGKRRLQGQELSVFDEIEVLEPGGYQTYGVQVVCPGLDDYADLGTRADQAGVGLDDWSSIVALCQHCSEGTPHEHTSPTAESWQSDLQIGLAVHNESQARALIDGWLKPSAERKLIRFECVFSR